MIFKSEATKTFINVDDIGLFQMQETVELLDRHPDKSKVFESSAWIVLKYGNSFALTLPKDEMNQLWKMISDKWTEKETSFRVPPIIDHLSFEALAAKAKL